ncbi:MAG: hypothetical protein ACK5N0_10375 [Synechococcaceae cyanobacterium]
MDLQLVLTGWFRRNPQAVECRGNGVQRVCGIASAPRLAELIPQPVYVGDGVAAAHGSLSRLSHPSR